MIVIQSLHSNVDANLNGWYQDGKFEWRMSATGRYHQFAPQGSSRWSIETTRQRPEVSCTSQSCHPGERWRPNRASA